MSNNKTKGSLMAFSFLMSTVLTSSLIAAYKYYDVFLQKTAGTYNVAVLFGEPLKYFLIKVLLLAAGLIAFIVFFICGRKSYEKPIFVHSVAVQAVTWCVLPLISAYGLSRLTGLLLPQSNSGIAIIANVVFMMIGVCGAIISCADLVRQIQMLKLRGDRGNCFAMVLAGLPVGYAIAVLLVPLIEQGKGYGPIYPVMGVLVLIVGLLSRFCCDWKSIES